jgi:PAS domain S-box-containing protein
MQSAPLRDNEQASLDALVRLGVLDTDPEPEFDALVHAASALCGVPVSLISLVDADRQWLKANVGLPGVTETTRDIAFCAHAVRGAELFEVTDAAEDSRFADNRLVTEDPKIRFYAGAPISLSTGETVGTLCVIDRRPRRLQDWQRAALEHLAVAAAAALESRRARVLLQQTLRQSHRTAMVLQHTADAVIGLSDEGLIVLWNPAAERLFGYVEAEMIGQTFAILAPPENHSRQRELFRALLDGEARTYDSVGIHRSGTTISLSITSVPEIDPSGRLLGATAFLRDMSIRERAERELALSEARFRTLSDSSPHGVIFADAEGAITYTNSRCQEIYGQTLQQTLGPGWTAIVHPQDRSRVLEVVQHTVASRTEAAVEFHIVPVGGGVRSVRLLARPVLAAVGELIGFVGSIEDITLRRQAEEELDRHRHHLQELVDERTAALKESIERLNAEREAKIQSSKLEAMGTLAAGIAHDFNNILASILGHADLALDELPRDSEASNRVAKVVSGCFRARNLVARMLDFARVRPFAPKPMDLVLQVREVIDLLKASLPSSIEVEFQNGLRAASVMILADPIQIMQIVMNLCINASHALENRGVIVVSLERAGTIDATPREHADGICLTVADRGSGMTPEVLERIFDPFFTTKPPGEGSGLGLSVVYGIVKDLGGVLTVDSSVAPQECGTRFHVFLPAAQTHKVAGLESTPGPLG